MAALTFDSDEPGVLRVAGELDCSSAPDLLAAAIARPPIGVLDLGDVTFLDMAGLSALLAIIDRGDAVRVRAASAPVRRAVTLAGVSERLGLDADPTPR